MDNKTFSIDRSNFESLRYVNLLKKLIYLSSLDVVHLFSESENQKGDICYWCNSKLKTISPDEIPLVYNLFRKYGFLAEDIWSFYKEGCVGDVPEQKTLLGALQFKEGLELIKENHKIL
jgi:hypothetical protein